MGAAAVVAAAFLWATLGIGGKVLYAAGASPLAVVAWRAFLAAGLLAVVLAGCRPDRLYLPRSAIPFFALYGLVVAANYAGYFLALRHTTVAVAILLLYTYPVFTVLAARLVFAEPLDLSKLTALGLAFGGVSLVGPWGGEQIGTVSPAGLVFGLGAALAMAGYGLMGKRAVQVAHPLTAALYSFAFAALWLAVAAGPRWGEVVTYSPAMWGALLYLALGPTLAGYGLFLWALERIEVGSASLWAMCEPPLAALLALVVLGETFTLRQAIGACCILIAVGILGVRRGQG